MRYVRRFLDFMGWSGADGRTFWSNESPILDFFKDVLGKK